MLKWLKRLLIGFVSLILLVVIAALIIWQWPGIVITEGNLAKVAQRLRPEIDLSWQKLDVKASSQSFFKKRVGIQTSGFCFRLDSQRLEVCARELSLDAVVDLRGFSWKVDLGPVKLAGGTFRMNPPPSPKEEPKKDEKDSNPLAILERVKIHDIETQWDSVLFNTPELNISGKAKVALQALLAWNIDADAKLVQGKVTRQVGLKLTSAGKGDEEVSYKLDASYREAKQHFTLSGTGNASPTKLVARLTGSAKNLVEMINDLSFRDCHLEVEAGKDTLLPKHVQWQCPIFVNGIVAKSKTTGRKFLLGRLEVKTKLDFVTEPQKKTVWSKGKAEVSVDPIFPQANDGAVSVKLSTQGPLSEPKAWLYDFDTKVDIAHFERWVDALSKSPWAAPAPINVLSGSINAKASGKGKFLSEGGAIPIELTTHLRSQQQRLMVDAKGDLTFAKKNGALTEHLTANVFLSDLVVVLPYIGLGEVPRIAPDGRIRTTPLEARRMAGAQEAPSTFTYDINLETKQLPIRVKTDLAKADVPVNLKIKLVSEKAPTGFVRIASFPAEIFRRKATIEEFAIRLEDPTDTSEVKGEVTVAYSDYTIKIEVIGLMNRPQIKLSSEPPLPQDKVISLLLFGKVEPEALNSDQAVAVGNTRAAMEDKAMSLASMYVFASTPVENVAYNRDTKTLQAKVRLADGTSLTVGTNLRKISEVGVRQRLGGNWYISTYYSSNDPLDNLKKSVTALLEWSKGY